MRHARLAACLLSALALPAPALADDPADGAWRGNLGFGLSYSAGNTDAGSASLAADAVRATPEDKLAFSAAALRGRSRKDGVTTTTADFAKASGRYDRNLDGDWFAFGSLGLEHDRLQRLDLRTALNAGLGNHVVKTDAHSLDVFGGAGATDERFEELTRDFGELVLGEESSHRLTDTTTLRQRLAVYPNLEESGEYRAEFDASVATAIDATWSLKVTLSNRYLSNPLPGLDTTDTVLLVGLAARFGPK